MIHLAKCVPAFSAFLYNFLWDLASTGCYYLCCLAIPPYSLFVYLFTVFLFYNNVLFMAKINDDDEG